MKPTAPWKWTVEEAMQKYEQIKKCDIDHLRTWLKGETHLPSIPDEQIVLFYHACKYDVDKTKETIEKCYMLRTNVKELFANRDPTHKYVQNITKTVIAAPLRGYDKDGNLVVAMRLHDTDPEKYYYGASLKQIFMSMDGIQLEHGPVPGYVFILDGKGYTLSHMLRSSLSLCRRFIQYSQEGSTFFPKAIYVVNVSSVLEKVVSLIKPFMKSDLFSVISFHKPGKFDAIHKQVPIEIVPEEYGGKGGPLPEIHDEHLAKMLTYKDWFQEEEKLRIDETKRKGGKKYVKILCEDEPEMPSLRTLAID